MVFPRQKYFPSRKQAKRMDVCRVLLGKHVLSVDFYGTWLNDGFVWKTEMHSLSDCVVRKGKDV